ncbi:unnamed protein product, partial [Brachionus calyciflorus]
IFGKVDHYWSRIECQNRGSLHAHILLWIKNVDKDLVSAELPRGNDDQSIILRNLVKKYQIHKCVDRRCFRSKKRFFKKCKYGFPYDLCDQDHIDDNFKYYYKRTKNEDRDVGPYNKMLLMLWEGLVNVQYCTKRGLEQYLVKYISKVEPTFGAKEVKKDTNEITKYFDLRIVSSVEAVAFVFGHHFVQSNIKVSFIPTSLPNEEFLKKKDELMELDEEDKNIFKDSLYDHYLNRPINHKTNSLTFFDYHQQYQIYLKDSKTMIPTSRLSKILNDLKGNNIVIRKNPIITRSNYFDETDGEIYFYQKLLYNVPFRDFKELLSVANQTMTYKEECIIRNIIKISNDSEPTIEFLTVNHLKDPKIILDLNNHYHRNYISENCEQAKTDEIIFNDSQIYIEDQTNNDQEIMINEIQIYDNIHESFEQGSLLKLDLNLPRKIEELASAYEILTKCQKKIVDSIKNREDQQNLFFIFGAAGTGKSFLIKYINDYYILKNYDVKKLATTGLAARSINGETVHSFFAIDTELDINLEFESSKWHRIKNCEIVIVDEVSMLNDKLLDRINEVLQVVTKQSTRFGGKSLIFFGDLFQLPAISTISLPVNQLYETELFTSNFFPFLLETNVRQKNDIDFQNFLNNCRIGRLKKTDIEYISKIICGLGHPITNECMDLNQKINLSSLHAQRNDLINKLTKKKSSDSKVIISKDIDYFGNLLNDHNIMIINNRKGSLEHKLEVYPECTYINHSENVLLLKLEDGSIKTIPRLKQRIVLHKSSQVFYRIQFPILNASVLTIHKVQGLTIKKCHTSIDNTIFSEGQAYVALSRVQNAKSLHLKRFIVDAIKVDENVERLWEYIKEKVRMKNFQVHHNHTKNFQLPSTIIEVDVKNESQNSQPKNNTKMIKENNPFFTKDNSLNIEGTINYFIKSKELSIKNFELDDHLLNYSIRNKL